jgi:hypothetical protein
LGLKPPAPIQAELLNDLLTEPLPPRLDDLS